MRVACIYFLEPTHLQKFAERCVRFSPQICLRKNEAIFIEIGRCRTLYTEDHFLEEVRKLLQTHQLRARVTIKDSVIIALVSAIYETDDFAKVPISALPLFSDPYALSKDENAVKIEAILKKVAVRSILDFSKLTDSQIGTRFGKLGAHWKRLVREPEHFPWPRWSPRENIIETLLLSHDDACGTIEPLLFKSKEVLDRIFDRIRNRGLRLLRIRIELKLERFSSVRRKVRKWDFDFSLPQETTQNVLPILRERWDKDFRKDPLESLVLEVRFEVLEMTDGFEAQRNYIDQSQEVKANYNAMISHLAEKNGKDRVYKAILKKRRLPEYSWEKQTDHSLKGIKLLETLPERPTKVIPSPIPIRVTDDKIFLSKKSKSYTTIKWSEVEKLRDQWLDGVIERDYYKVTIQEGSPLWIFKTSEGEYFLHGWFE